MSDRKITGTERGVRIRTCAGCGTKQDKAAMLRIVRASDGTVTADPSGKADGRGAYLCRSIRCLEKAGKRKSLERTLRAAVPQDVFGLLREEIEKNGTE